MTISLKNSYNTQGGTVHFYEHESRVTKTPMKFSVFMPGNKNKNPKKTLLWLSGLTCTEENFMVKSGVQKRAQALDMAIICPDTSPRGLNLPMEHDNWDFGSGAGFYLDATQAPWSENYLMHSYIMQDLLPLAKNHFPIDPSRIGISGHSMGGLGALMLGIRYPEVFRSISAFAPICAPSQAPWGIKAFTGYLGADKSSWEKYDPAILLAENGYSGSILVHQGTADEAMATQLMPDKLEAAAISSKTKLCLKRSLGYDHSYYFVATFIDDHLDFHCEQMNRLQN